MKRVLLAATVAMLVGGLHAEERVDLSMTGRIRTEAFQRSQVMPLLTHLTEDIGPRLTNSPAMAKANAWTRSKFNEWGLANVHDEAMSEPFGRGWEFRSASMEMLGPRAFPLHALPKAWTPGTNGPVEGEAIAAKLEKKEDLEKFKGKLKGKIVFLSEARAYKPGEKPDWNRETDDTLHAMKDFTVPADQKPEAKNEARERRLQRLEFAPLLNKFLVDEGAVGSVSQSSWDNGVIVVSGGGSRKAGESVGVPSMAMAAEHYNAVMRALDRKETVRLRMNVDANFTSDTDQPAYNTIAEIPGTGPHRNEVVMIGAHMDSWHGGTGAADNGAGVAVMMEAMRILKAVGAKPDRTIRVALWTGEEQGLLGSADYVSRHFGHFPEPTDPKEKALPAFLRTSRGQLQPTGEYNKLAAYFNVDNGGGKIRGVYAQENMEAAPIFEQWLTPFNDVGATVVTQRNTGSTDHISFDAIGLPGFQFVQDGLDYFTNVHHTDLDVLDHIVPEDLKQASAIVASFAYDAAMRPEKLPRKPVAAE
ncbi:M20/M25/M40 family metallo-hydrolase [Lysobacter sp. KIS68-7]|uniref:M20/M25/M40 family metallo-hydrolase n=1 Tax=Lysobacter sp. KIS68-7 TaxID=2904252 RepID=UPI001E446223|nr:M20/M25/M40 family metallo-hydrolase [Lysobacter sp. KIS68-7]UHQ19848.1 M20/M25/M40 family metallo-hydrolase [Lysobacter sp. KIS68-7]